MSKIERTVIERREGLNGYGTRVVYEIVKIKTPSETDYVWYETIGQSFTTIKKSFKNEWRMRKAMESLGFYAI